MSITFVLYNSACRGRWVNIERRHLHSIRDALSKSSTKAVAGLRGLEVQRLSGVYAGLQHHIGIIKGILTVFYYVLTLLLYTDLSPERICGFDRG